LSLFLLFSVFPADDPASVTSAHGFKSARQSHVMVYLVP